MSDIQRVKSTIRDIYGRRLAALYALALASAGYTIRSFRARQPAARGARGKYWTNRTGQAAARMFTRAFREQRQIGFLMAHGVPYGVYLELKDNRRNEAIRPEIEKQAPRFFEEARKLYGRG